MSPLSARAALVVDDSPAMRKQLCQALQRAGMHTVEAGDGAQAWRQLQSAQVDVILTDINMPILDGLKLVGLVRAGGRHRATPVVVITTEAGEPDRRRAEGLGANGYLVKPVQSQQVLEVVTRLLRVS
jgi:two-component system, chemotaxis family, chemotaxis protein CheY